MGLIKGEEELGCLNAPIVRKIKQKGLCRKVFRIGEKILGGKRGKKNYGGYSIWVSNGGGRVGNLSKKRVKRRVPPRTRKKKPETKKMWGKFARRTADLS